VQVFEITVKLRMRRKMKKQRILYEIIVIFLIFLMGTFFHACFNDSEDGSGGEGSKIYGTLTYNGETDSAFYIILDDNTASIFDIVLPVFRRIYSGDLFKSAVEC
jgi:hypothetical protein